MLVSFMDNTINKLVCTLKKQETSYEIISVFIIVERFFKQIILQTYHKNALKNSSMYKFVKKY